MAYEQRITIANDQLARQLFELNQKTQMSILELMMIAGKDGIEYSVFKQLIATVYIDIQNRTNQLLQYSNPINITEITPFYINKTLEDSIRTALDNVGNDLENQNKLKQQYDDQYYKLVDGVDLLKQQSQNFSTQLLNWLNEIKQPLPGRYHADYSNPFGFLNDIGNDVANVVNTVSGGMLGILNAPMSIFSSAKNFINGIITLLPLIGLVFGSALLGVFIGPPIMNITFSMIKSSIHSTLKRKENRLENTSIPRSPSHIMAVHDSGPDTSDLSPLIPTSQTGAALQRRDQTNLHTHSHLARLARNRANQRKQ